MLQIRRAAFLRLKKKWNVPAAKMVMVMMMVALDLAFDWVLLMMWQQQQQPPPQQQQQPVAWRY
jgi:hypothetical protein